MLPRISFGAEHASFDETRGCQSRSAANWRCTRTAQCRPHRKSAATLAFEQIPPLARYRPLSRCCLLQTALPAAISESTSMISVSVLNHTRIPETLDGSSFPPVFCFFFITIFFFGRMSISWGDLRFHGLTRVLTEHFLLNI